MNANRKLRRKKADDTTATMRRFVMLQLIPWEPGSITTTDLHKKLEAAGYTVETRTIQRDLTELMGPFHYSSELRGRTLHWFWPRHCKPLSIREISPATALALNLAESHLRHLLPNSALELLQSYFDQARQTLSSQDPKKFGRWTEKVRVGTHSSKNKLYLAFRELGAVICTMFLLRYLDDLVLRQTVHAATNKSEEFNYFVKWVFFGSEGTVQENIRSEQQKLSSTACWPPTW